MTFALVSGATLGRYQLLVPLGQGGMGSVWVAREVSPTSGKDRLVALKVMRPELAAHSNFRAMFLKEGQLVKSLEHPNVVHVHEVAEHEGVLYLAMEWVEGESLDSLFQEASKRKPIPAEMAVRIIADTAYGLHTAHELRGWDGELEGIVHRDVSPHNILIGLDGRIKVADFGLAKASASSGVATEGPHGKYSYMSPEQARGQVIDRRSDVFSLGVVLYELTTGQRLFKGVDKHHTLGLVMECKVPLPSSLNQRYPERLESIVLKALANRPEDRFQSAEEFRVALEKFLVQERTLVSASSVAALLRRVLRHRLQERRQRIHDALTSSIGHVSPDLLPDTSLMSSSSQLTELAELGSRPSQPTASETPHGISRSRTSMLAPQPPQRQAAVKFAIWGGGGAAIAFTLMLVLGKLMQQPEDPRAATPQTHIAAARDGDADEFEEPQVEGVSVSDLPIEEQKKKKKQAPARVWRPAAPAAPAPAASAAKPPNWLESAATVKPPAQLLEDSDAAEAEDTEQAESPTKLPPKAADVYGTASSPTPTKSAADPKGEEAGTPKVVLEEESKPAPKREPYRLRVPGADEAGL